MKKERINNLLDFIDKTPNAYCCVKNIKEILTENGFQELFESDEWNNLKKDGKYFVCRNDSSIIAFTMSDNKGNAGFNITTTHTDSPSFMIKTNSEMFENEYLKLNVTGYGGMINYSWLDRPLSIAGRVIVLDKGIYKKQIINIDKDLLVIPSQAIHINEEANENFKLNHQDDMLPIISLHDDKKIEDILNNLFNELNIKYDKICDYDLFLYNRDKAKIIGLNDEFILAPRLDDLACVVTALYSFLDAKNKFTFNVFCSLNNEEIGSLSQQGADSTFLINTLTRIASITEIDLPTALSNSLVLSVDNAHAIHPNKPQKNDPTNKVYLNYGVVIQHHTSFTTDALTSSLFKGICDKAKVPYQDYVSRSDMSSGGTLGNISQSHVGVDSVDIGLAQLAMHSANELIGVKDIYYLYKSLLEFYQTKVIKDKDIIKLKKEQKKNL